MIACRRTSFASHSVGLTIVRAFYSMAQWSYNISNDTKCNESQPFNHSARLHELLDITMVCCFTPVHQFFALPIPCIMWPLERSNTQCDVFTLNRHARCCMFASMHYFSDRQAINLPKGLPNWCVHSTANLSMVSYLVCRADSCCWIAKTNACRSSCGIARLTFVANSAVYSSSILHSKLAFRLAMHDELYFWHIWSRMRVSM
jgi:hypothetical protein